MDSKLRNRIIGAVVLTSFAVVLLPSLFDGSAQDRERFVANIPNPPNIMLRDLSFDALRKNMQQIEQDSAAKLPIEIVDQTDYSENTNFALDRNRLPIAWSLQLGSFEEEKNARNLRTVLREAEYRSYITSSRTRQGQRFKVFVGPMIDKTSLEKISVEIRTSMDIEGLIVRYRIEDDSSQLGG